MKKKIILSCLVVGMSLFGCSSSKTETGKKEVQTTKKEESKKEETKKEETKKEESKPVETPTQSNTVNPDLKAFLDSYESFMDEYVDYMNKLSEDPTNTELMLGYADMLAKYADFTDKIDAYDESTMSDADLAYYLEVQSRVLNKLSNVQ